MKNNFLDRHAYLYVIIALFVVCGIVGIIFLNVKRTTVFTVSTPEDNIDVSDYVGTGCVVSEIQVYDYSNSSEHDYKKTPDNSDISAILKTIVNSNYSESSREVSDTEYDNDCITLVTDDSIIMLYYDYQGILVQITKENGDNFEDTTTYELTYSDVEKQISTGHSNEEMSQMSEDTLEQVKELKNGQ